MSTPDGHNPTLLTLDCRGKQCPAPILEIAKFAKKNPQPTTVTVLATDENFPADLEAWCRSTKNQLQKLSQRADGVYMAIVSLGLARGSEERPKSRKVVALSPSDADPTNIGIPLSDAAEGAEVGFTNDATRIEPLPLKSISKGSLRVEQDPIQTGPLDLEEARRTKALPTTQSREAPTEAISLCELGGLSSEEALLRLSGLVLQAASGSLRVSCDAPDFGEKLRAWAPLTGVQLKDLQREGTRTTALLTRAGHHEALPLSVLEQSPAPRENRASLCVMHNSFEALYVAMMMANSSASQGVKVDIFFCFWGVALLRAEKPKPKKKRANALTRFFQRVIQLLTPKGPRRQKLSQLHFGGVGDQMLGYIMKQNQAQTLEELLQSAVEQKVRFLVCATSLGLLGLSKEDLMELPNLEIAGMTAFTEAARRGSFSFNF